MIVRKGQKLGSVLIDKIGAEPKPKKQAKKAPAKKTAEVNKPEPTSSTEKGDEADGTRPSAPATDRG